MFEAMRGQLVEGKILYTDSTHLKASANKNKYEKKLVGQSTRSYLAELEIEINRDRKAHGKKALKEKAAASELRKRR